LNTASYKVTVKKQNGSCKSPKYPAMEATNSEHVYDPELFGLGSIIPVVVFPVTILTYSP